MLMLYTLISILYFFYGYDAKTLSCYIYFNTYINQP